MNAESVQEREKERETERERDDFQTSETRRNSRYNEAARSHFDQFSRNLFFPGTTGSATTISRFCARSSSFHLDFAHLLEPLRHITSSASGTQEGTHSAHRLKLSESFALKGERERNRERVRERKRERKRYSSLELLLKREESRAKREGCSTAREAFSRVDEETIGRRRGNERENRFWLPRETLSLPPSLPPFPNRSTALVERVPTERVKEEGEEEEERERDGSLNL